jgi:predicted AAA+ superfamily ATPase
MDDHIISIQGIMLARMAMERLRTLFRSFPVVAVTGARQVGKSTLLQQTFGDRGWPSFVFDPVLDVANARKDPDLFLDNHPPPLILDEIQFAPELASALKRRIDRRRTPGQYLLSGSQQWSVMKSLAESLAGRVAFLDLHGFSLAELSRKPPAHVWLEQWLAEPQGFPARKSVRLDLPRPLFEQLWRGFLPEAQFLDLQVIPDFHLAYQRTYLERDVRLLADITNWDQFGRFLRLAAALTAQEVNQSQLGREIGLTPQTVRRWLDLLKATFQWFEVPAYSGNAIKRVSQKPKGYLGDSGFGCFAQAISSPSALSGHPLLGALFETAVVAEIRKMCTLLSPPPLLYHWRSHGGAEVDLLLERDGRLFPIEIKATSRPSRSDTRGITAFRETYPRLRISKGLVIAPTEAVLAVSENDYAMPWDLAG